MATIQELESFKLSDAVKFHDKLNPNLWIGTQLDPKVKKQLMLIAEDFITTLGISDLDVRDITISGSNAAYSYTAHSDLDLHILVDMDKLQNNEIYRELFTAKKTLYNDQHDITIRNVPVELYVQDTNQVHTSLGEYSVLNDKWIRIPKKQRANFNQAATKAKYESLAELIELAMKTADIDRVKKMIDMVKRYRQAGLAKGGEFSPENLAYKAVRSQGGIDALYDLRDKLHSDELSIEEASSLEEASSREDAINKINKLMNTSGRTDSEIAIFNNHIEKLMKKFNIRPDEIEMSSGREPVDPLKAKIAKAADERRQAADALKREWEWFKSRFFKEDAKLDEAYTTKQQVIDALYNLPDKLHSDELSIEEVYSGPKMKFLRPGELKGSYSDDYLLSMGFKKAQNGSWYISQVKWDKLRGRISEASGYIPSAKEKNDPRFKTALTVDVKPDAIKKNAKAFGFKTSRAGIPPQARADGKIAESLINEGMTFSPATEKESSTGEKYWTGSDWDRKLKMVCRDCERYGQVDQGCVYCRGTGQEEYTVSDAPELYVSNTNGEEIQRMFGIENPDYSGTIRNEDLPEIMSKLILLKNKGSQQHTQDASVERGAMRRQPDDQGVARIGPGPTMHIGGRSQGQVDGYIDKLIEIVRFAQDNNVGIGWG